jgi:CHAT domain-containing protein
MRPGIAGTAAGSSIAQGARTGPGADLAAEADSLLAPLRATGSAALSYAFANDTLFTWLLLPSGQLELAARRPVQRDTLERLVASVRAGLDAGDARRAALGPDELAGDTVARRTAGSGGLAGDLRRLADLLLPDSLERRVPPGTGIAVVPTGVLGLVPFAALPVGPAHAGTRRPVAPAMLGLRYAVRYAPSFAALRVAERRAMPLPSLAAREAAASRPGPAASPAAASRPSATRQARGGGGAPPARLAALPRALVVGNPAMPVVYSGRWVNRGRLRPLPGAEAEGRWVASTLGARLLTGGAATESAVMVRLAQAPVIHLATHGLAYSTEARARQSFVAFAPDANSDGRLTVGEILDDPSLALTADLVVLSACQTGLGNLKQAEGTVGLQRAFLAKGARSVLVSLWSVDDRATRLLMERFYAHWLGERGARPVGKAEALRRAQADLQAVPAYAHPRYWAAFQLVGAN